jgi:hypothetical protein
LKVLYGLRQAPRTWNSRLDDTLKKNFVQSEPKHAMYRLCASRPSMYVSVINDNHLISLMNFNAAKVD